MSPNFINYYGFGGLAFLCAPQPGRQALWPNVASPLDRNDFLSGDWPARQSLAGSVVAACVCWRGKCRQLISKSNKKPFPLTITPAQGFLLKVGFWGNRCQTEIQTETLRATEAEIETETENETETETEIQRESETKTEIETETETQRETGERGRVFYCLSILGCLLLAVEPEGDPLCKSTKTHK